MFYKEKIDLLQNQLWEYQNRIKTCEDCGCLVYKDEAIKKKKDNKQGWFYEAYYCKKCAPKEIMVSGVEYKKK